MVIGESGVGKSTIVNMLFNQDTSEDCCRSPCPTGSTADSVTKSSTFHANVQSRWCLVDTVGIGDPTLTELQVVGAIRSMIRQTIFGVDCVVVVVKMERVPAASRANLSLLSKVFYPQGLKTNAVLVLTHWDGDLGNEDEDMEEWLGRDDEMRGVVASFSQVILTNNKLRRGAYPECRRACLTKLTNCIRSQQCRIRTRPVNIRELVKELLHRFRDVLWKQVVSIKDFAVGTEATIPTYCGECVVCMERIELMDVHILPCNHAFHKACLGSCFACPICRAPFQPGHGWSFGQD